MIGTVYGRIAAVFALLMLSFGALLGWIYLDSHRSHQAELVQQLSHGLAAHIAGHWPLLTAEGFDRRSVEELFHMLMIVNPSIEVYLLNADGVIQSHLAPPGHLKRDRVSLEPIKQFINGAATPLVGDDPRSDSDQKIFSSTPLEQDGKTAGYLYVILAGEEYEKLAANLVRGQAMQSAGWTIGAVLLITLAAGLLLFALITRPLNALTSAVKKFRQHDFPPTSNDLHGLIERKDEIGQLAAAFADMAARISTHVAELKRQDLLRRELVANVSHDLRTPLTSLQGYLETLQRKSDSLTAEERERFLGIAVRQSSKVGHLARELFELAKLECDEIKPNMEVFSIAELAQDVFQKFELSAERKGVILTDGIQPKVAAVTADIGMIERVLTNLLDNAVRHTEKGGEIGLHLTNGKEDAVSIAVTDSGAGISADQLSSLFDRSSSLNRPGDKHRQGGLGLIIVARLLALHDSVITVDSEYGKGSSFRFDLKVSGLPPLSEESA